MRKYRIGHKIKINGGVAKITSLNSNGTFTINWVKPPKGAVKGAFAGTLPAYDTQLTLMDTNMLNPESDTTVNYRLEKHNAGIMGNKNTIKKDFVKDEEHIRMLFKPGETFTYQGEELTSAGAYKPSIQSGGGEPKTDIYIEAVNNKGAIVEIKISYKKNNAEFLENKMSPQRAESVFGETYKQQIQQIAEQLNISEREFHNEQNQSYVLGYRLDIMSTPAKGYAPTTLTEEQTVDLYAGTSLPESKRNAIVNGKQVENSGVPNYIIIGDRLETAQDVINKMTPIGQYVKTNPEVHVAFKAVNYFAAKDKWDGNRPLAIHVNWNKNPNGEIIGTVADKTAYETTCNPVAENLRNLLK